MNECLCNSMYVCVCMHAHVCVMCYCFYLVFIHLTMCDMYDCITAVMKHNIAGSCKHGRSGQDHTVVVFLIGCRVLHE